MIHDNFVRVWQFGDAPPELQALSTNGGDEDWLAVVPPGLAKAYFPWLDCEAFGCCERIEIDVDEAGGAFEQRRSYATDEPSPPARLADLPLEWAGAKIVIGCHS